MRLPMSAIALLLAAAGTCAGSPPQAPALYLDAADLPSLRAGLLRLVNQQLERQGLFADPQHAWLTLSVRMPAAEGFEVRSIGWGGAGLPSLPLSFEIRPLQAGVYGDPIQASLAVQLLQDQWVAARRLRRGSAV